MILAETIPANPRTISRPQPASVSRGQPLPASASSVPRIQSPALNQFAISRIPPVASTVCSMYQQLVMKTMVANTAAINPH